ncbi:MAG: hypothetical protein J0I06_20770 [Planctomycetes bacterium]|nr:hypothetical protein [Planctomycetota bacterium]
MRTPDTGYVSTVLAASEAPCVSIYLPIRRGPGGSNGNGQADLARFRDLSQQAEEVLTKAHPGAARGIADQLHQLRDDDEFWRGALGGVVVLASPARFDAFTLPRAVPEHVEVGESFHVKPLLRYAQSAEPFHVLGVSKERVALFRGNRYVLTPLHAPGVQLTITEALGPISDTPTPGLHAAGPESTTRPNARAGGADSHGHLVGQGQAVRKIDTHPDAERFFREVDRQIIQRVSEPSGLPLILLGIDENLAAFRQVTKNRFITPEAVHGDWTKWTLHEIREAAWKAFEKHYLDRLARIREDFGTAAAHKRGTADLAEAAKAAAVGRVGVLLIDADRKEPGTIDLTTGALHPTDGKPCAGDMLDDLAELGLKTKAMVVVTTPDQMPTQTGLAAIYRY